MVRSKLTFYELFWIFLIGSFFGWLVEGIYDLVVISEFRNHSSFIYGPIGGAYGIGAVLITICLYRLSKTNIFKVFLVSFLLGSIGEYIMSWGMELVLGFSAWDYSGYILNINGRICLLFSIFWGFLGIAWVKLIYPFLHYMIDLIPYKIGKIAMICLIILLCFDIIISFFAVTRQKNRKKGIEADNKIEEWLDKQYSDSYLEKVYPGINELNK